MKKATVQATVDRSLLSHPKTISCLKFDIFLSIDLYPITRFWIFPSLHERFFRDIYPVHYRRQIYQELDFSAKWKSKIQEFYPTKIPPWLHLLKWSARKIKEHRNIASRALQASRLKAVGDADSGTPRSFLSRGDYTASGPFWYRLTGLKGART